MNDDGSVCQGNWRAIVKDYEGKIGKSFKDDKGVIWTFFGLVWADDDFYYGMWSMEEKRLVLHTCCGYLEASFEAAD